MRLVGFVVDQLACCRGELSEIVASGPARREDSWLPFGPATSGRPEVPALHRQRSSTRHVCPGEGAAPQGSFCQPLVLSNARLRLGDIGAHTRLRLGYERSGCACLTATGTATNTRNADRHVVVRSAFRLFKSGSGGI